MMTTTIKTPNNSTPSKISQVLAAFGVAMVLPLAAHAADPKPMTSERAAMPAATTAPGAGPVAGTVGAPYSDRAQMGSWNNDKDMLKREMAAGHDRGWYTKMLADKGYQITSVNADSATEVEYEVVKGRQTYEIQMNFDKAGGMAKSVNVNSNMWRADATKQVMAGNTVPAATAFVKGNEVYRDRTYMKTWSGEKDRLEKVLGIGHDRGYYAAELKKMGYQVTSTNDNEKDYVEYEIVKGTNSYEVQVNFDNGKSTKIDVATNMWQSDGTERAMDMKKGK